MSPPPLPPDNLATRAPEWETLPEGAVIHRFYNLGPDSAPYDPIYYDRSLLGRLNAPDARFGVLYAAQSIRGAFAETFLRHPGRQLIPADVVRKKGYATLRVLRPLKLIALHGAGLARLGATAEVLHGGLPYDAPQQWSAALRGLRPAPDGIAYRARHDDDEIAYAIYDSRRPAVEVMRRITKLDDEDWFWSLALQYGAGRAPRGI